MERKASLLLTPCFRMGVCTQINKVEKALASLRPNHEDEQHRHRAYTELFQAHTERCDRSPMSARNGLVETETHSFKQRRAATANAYKGFPGTWVV